jgi:CRP/FNR family transcriptional regulator, anaerobic regulatory protein
MNELEQYIKNTFAVTQEDLSKISAQFKKVEIPKGDFFLKAGRLSDRLGFVRAGLMRIYASAGDKEVTQWISTKGYFVTDLSSFVFHTPSRRNIQALTDCEVYTIDREQYQDLDKIIPKWAEIDKLFIARCFIIMEDRIFSHLYMTAEERYNALFEQQPELFNQVPLQYLASMLGMTPETLSRIRKKHLS